MASPLPSWLHIPPGSDFSLLNLPFGIVSHSAASSPHPAVAVGDLCLDLCLFSAHDGFAHLSSLRPHLHVFSQPRLNAFAALGRPVHALVRQYLQQVFIATTPYPQVLRDNDTSRQKCLILRNEVTMHLPMSIGDYTDFYAGLNHAYNCGVIIRGPKDALQPNYKHLPVGYHGRASSIVVSDTPVKRPYGQILQDPRVEANRPSFQPCKRLDMELELAAFICTPNVMGEPVDVDDALQHVFGFVLMNDWSARDIQTWEYVPLGPFNSKNFATSISPWIVLAEALEPFRTQGLANNVEILEYLRQSGARNFYDIDLRVELHPRDGQVSTICRTNASNLLFSFPQMIAHHTAGGCPMNTGDLLGSGTISGTEAGSFGSMLESSQGGKVPVQLESGVQRLFLEDGDSVTFRGRCGNESMGYVGFGECRGVILPAPTLPSRRKMDRA